MSESVASVLLVPGLGNSGPSHWQSIWQARNMSFRRVMQRDWNVPNLEEWLENLEAAVREAEAPIVIVAHSLSCSLVAHWMCLGFSERVAAAMLVSLADADSDAHMPPEARAFSPVPLDPLPFRAMVIASSTDPYLDIGRARLFARC
jgi:predicted alpha/beta hydrolase family esterase